MNSNKYPRADITVDCVVFGVDLIEAQLYVLLIKRGQPDEPGLGEWAVPGGFIKMDESLDASARRTLARETGITVGYLEQLKTFGDPARDPRRRIVSVAYMGLVAPGSVVVRAGASAVAAAQWYQTGALPDLWLDHGEIVAEALRRLRSKVRWQPVGVELLPDCFTLSELQAVYEIILGRSLDKRNFRRKVMRLDVLSPQDEYRQQAHRPAQLYRFDQARYESLQREGIDFEV